MSLKDLLGQPDYIDEVGNIYPIKLKDYEDFFSNAGFLYIKKELLGVEEENINILDILVYLMKMQDEHLIEKMEKVFSIVTRQNVIFVQGVEEYRFQLEDGGAITTQNYADVRKAIMKQNLIFEQKVYKNPLVREWAERVLQVRAKNAVKMTMEDMISTIHVYTGIRYNDLAEQTIYQINASFQRINKLKSYDTSVMFSTAGAKINIDYYAEEINLFKDPYDDIFVGKDKLTGFNDALK